MNDKDTLFLNLDWETFVRSGIHTAWLNQATEDELSGRFLRRSEYECAKRERAAVERLAEKVKKYLYASIVQDENGNPVTIRHYLDPVIDQAAKDLLATLTETGGEG